MMEMPRKESDRRLRRSRIGAAARAFVPRRGFALFGRGVLPGLAALPLLLALALPALGADLKVTIDGVRSHQGSLMIGLYDSAEGFNVAIKHSTAAGLLNDKSRLVGAAIRAAGGTQSTVFTQLPPGRYAVIVFHDENDNGRLDVGAWGVPTEGYGFSNNAQGLLAAPSFDAAAVTLDGADKDIAIALIYPKRTVRAPSPAKELE